MSIRADPKAESDTALLPGALAQYATTCADIRQFFAERQVTEVQTPLLDSHSVTDPELHSLKVVGEGWLQTSPEYAMKRLLAAGSGDIYQIAHAFRAQERGSHHLTEFTLLEWYRLGYDHIDLMHEAAQLLALLLGGELVARSYRECFEGSLDVNPHRASLETLQQLVAQKVPWQGDAPEYDLCLNLLFSHCVEPQFDPGQITAVYDYPASQAALARVRKKENLASRFELFCGGVELGNGFHELNDADEQRRRFEADNAVRRARGVSVMALDERLLRALQRGLPDCAGVAIGLDRVLMLQLGADNLSQAVLTRHSLQ